MVTFDDLHVRFVNK